VRQDSGRVTFSRLRNHADSRPEKLASSEDEGGDFGALKLGHSYRITVSAEADGEVAGRLFDLSHDSEAIMTLRSMIKSSDRGHLGVYSRNGESLLIKQFTASAAAPKQ